MIPSNGPKRIIYVPHNRSIERFYPRLRAYNIETFSQGPIYM